MSEDASVRQMWVSTAGQRGVVQDVARDVVSLREAGRAGEAA